MIQKEQDVKIQNMISSRSTLRDTDIADGTPQDKENPGGLDLDDENLDEE